jgi:predicted phage terminase large subunit-like protein
MYMSEHEYGLFGGAAGPGKSEALLVSAVQFADLPNHATIIVRKHYVDFTKPGALMDRAEQWFRGRGPKFNQQNHTWTFPSGYKVVFVALDTPHALDIIQGMEAQCILIDEAGQLQQKIRHYLRTRLRRPVGSIIPIRVRETANPDGPGEIDLYHEYVEPWENGSEAPDHFFIPATLDSNPHIDGDYRERLNKLDPVTRAKYLHGKWGVRSAGRFFLRQSVKRVPASELPSEFDALVRTWDLAATEPTPENSDPDWTRGTLSGIKDGFFYILDVLSLRHRHHFVRKLIHDTAIADGREVTIVIPQDPGQAGKSQWGEYVELLAGFEVRRYQPPSDKETMARPVSASVDAGNVFVAEAPWTDDLLDELCAFPTKGIHDDQVDTLSSAWLWLPHLAKKSNGKLRVGVCSDPETNSNTGIHRPASLERPPAIRR